MRGVVTRRDDLENAETVLAVGDESESAGGDHADFYVIDVVEVAFCGEELIELWFVGLLYIDDRQTLLARGDVGVGARDVDVARVFERDDGVGDRLGLREVGYVQNFEAVAIGDEGVAELHGDAAGIVERGRADGGGDPRRERIVEVNNHERFVRKDIGVRAGDGDAVSAGEDAGGIEG